MTYMGGDRKKVRLTFQEFFGRMASDVMWGKPMAALLGALKVQKELGIPAIGGKDSMSGTFEDINVPPALVSFAVCAADADRIISTEFKKCGSTIVLVPAVWDENKMIDFEAYRNSMSKMRISVLASGGGTDFQSVIDAVESGYLEDSEIVQLIAGKDGIGAAERAEKHGIKVKAITKANYPDMQKKRQTISKEAKKC